MTAHAWSAGVRSGSPVMTCANPPCRNQPRSECKTTPVETTAAEFVQALMIGGAE